MPCGVVPEGVVGVSRRVWGRGWCRVVGAAVAAVLVVSVVESTPAVAAPAGPAGPAAPPAPHAVSPRALPVGPGHPAVASSSPRAGLAFGSDGTAERFDPARSTVVARSEFSDTFANPDGSHTVRLTSEPANVRDSAGVWRPVDTSVSANSVLGREVVGRHPLAPSFGADAADPRLLSVAADDGSAWLSLPAASAAPAVVSGSSVSYRDALPGTDLRYDVTPGSVKETLVLSAPPAVGRWVFDLGTSGLTPAVQPNGEVLLSNAAGAPVAVIPTIEVWDSGGGAGEPPAQTTGRYELTPTAGGWSLAVVVDQSWLDDPARVYPVSVDPSVVAWNSAVTSYKSDGTTTTNDGVKAGNSLGAVGGGDSYWRSIVKFDYTPIFGQNVVGSRVDVYWDQLAAQSHSSWQMDMWHATAFAYTARGEYLAAGQVGDAGNVRGIPSTTGGLDALTAYLKKMADTRTSTAQFMFGGAELPGRWTYKRAKIALLVDVGHAAPATTLVAPADNSVVTTTTPTLSGAAVTDADGEQVFYSVRVATGADATSGVVIDSPKLSSPTWTVPANVLQDGVAYTWQMRTYSGITLVTPTWVGHFRVDKRVGDHGPAPTDTVGPVTVNLANGNAEFSTSSPSFTTVGGSAGVSYTYNSQQADSHGLTVSYYNDTNHNDLADDGEPSLVRTEPQVNSNWGTGSPYPGVVGNDWFVARWQGFFQAPAAGTYQFSGSHDDSLKITVNGASVYSWATPSAPNYTADQNVGSVVLTAGQRVPITVELAEETGSAYVQLHVRTTDGTTVPDQVVPPEWLFRSDLPALPDGWTLSADVDGSGAAYTSALVTAQTVVLTDSSGAKHTWTKKSTGGYTPPAGEDGVLALDATGKVTLNDDDGQIYTFRTDGRPDLVTSSVDAAHPAALQYSYDTASPSRLRFITDPVSGRQVTLYYSRAGDTCYPGLTPPAGTDATPPAQMLCRIAYWDGRQTLLWYAAGRLARLEDPGAEITDFGYDATTGLLDQIRDPLVADWVAVDPATRDTTESWTQIAYVAGEGEQKVASVTSPAPAPGQPRPGHSYRYDPANHTSYVDVAGLTPAVGYATKVTYDTADRLLTSTDADGAVSSSTWDTQDRPLSTTDPAGRESTTVYDHAGRVAATKGPAPASCLAGTAITCDPIPETRTHYDEGMTSLAVAYYPNQNLAGSPAAYATGIGGPSGAIQRNWGTGSPAAGIPVNNWSARLTGEITLSQAGTYSVAITADDGFRLWIDDSMIIDHWGGLGTVQANFANPTAGAIHRIRVEYWDSSSTASLELDWTPPGGTKTVVPGSALHPRYGLVTSTENVQAARGAPALRTATQYANPALGLPTATVDDPAGAALTATTGYETGGYNRRTSRTLPGGNTYTYAYYGDAEAVDNPCTLAADPANQGGAVKTATSPTAADGTAITTETVYDSAGRAVATRTGTDPWTCTSYDNRDRPTSVDYPAFGGHPERLVTHDYAVGGDPLTTGSPTRPVRSPPWSTSTGVMCPIPTPLGRPRRRPTTRPDGSPPRPPRSVRPPARSPTPTTTPTGSPPNPWTARWWPRRRTRRPGNLPRLPTATGRPCRR